MNAAPLLVSFSSIDKYLEALSEENRAKYRDELQDLFSRSLPPVTSAYCLSILFGYSLKFIYALATEQQKFYRTFSIKQGKKSRRISSPKVALKVIQKWLAYHLDEVTDFSSHVHGFVRGRSFVGAAKQHIGSRWVYSIDIKEFFSSISDHNIMESLVDLGYSEKAADLLANLCCLNGVLAQGSPASPVLSNIYMHEFDKKLLEVAEKHSLIVTRYADDIVFSGQNELVEEIINEIESIFTGSELSLNRDKYYFADTHKGQRLKVHGLLVKEDRVTLTKGYRNKIRAYKHMIETGKVDESDKPRILGHIKFAESVDGQGD
jgi:RNA-directed DNA polymerase